MFFWGGETGVATLIAIIVPTAQVEHLLKRPLLLMAMLLKGYLQAMAKLSP